MSSDNNEVFTKANLDRYLNELSKEYKKLGGRRTPVDIVLIGGAAVIESYGFRDMTTDVDAIVPAASIMKEAIGRVASRFGLLEDWLNADFKMTDSFSPRLYEHSVFYRTFSQVLKVRMVTGEYLVAMKLRAGRQYKNDLSDIVGILAEHERKGAPMTYDMINRAVNELYGGWERFPEHSVAFIRNILEAGNYADIYEEIRESERDAHEVIRPVEEAYHGDIREERIESILEADAARGNRKSVLARLAELKHRQEANAPDSPEKGPSGIEDR
jgi:hypothetical protein